MFGMANRGIILVEDIHKLDEEKKEVLIKAMDTGEIRFRKSEDEEIVIPSNFKVIGTITGHVSSFETIDRRLFDLFDIRIELKDARKVNFTQVSMAKRNNVRKALEVARTARGILGASGISGEYQTMRHMCNLESVDTYEGTYDIHTLIVGQELTGIEAFS